MARKLRLYFSVGWCLPKYRKIEWWLFIRSEVFYLIYVNYVIGVGVVVYVVIYVIVYVVIYVIVYVVVYAIVYVVVYAIVYGVVIIMFSFNYVLLLLLTDS